ncbi:hypothetical protein Moror_11060 [Moniliophthora roreri MCA 2997]|uniref:Uncharacterized protein n=2 Tax=Moniliophthora roreri TaxID=221103 RepID=V2WCM9_MONRO|nr:hypothetical protein Moror_11060 [Moniliophthora roreri MCA 2997]
MLNKDVLKATSALSVGVQSRHISTLPSISIIAEIHPRANAAQIGSTIAVVHIPSKATRRFERSRTPTTAHFILSHLITGRIDLPLF